MFNLLNLYFVAVPALSMISLTAEQNPTPAWLWIALLVILVGLFVLVLWLGPRFAEKEAEPEEQQREATPLVEAHIQEEKPSSIPEQPVEPIVPDDLAKIEGIGPKISSVLQEAGITTFAQLAETDVARIEEILDKDTRLRLANPSTWPKQAALAAAGDWEGLEVLQDQLKGGREE
ncbi:MAG: DUF4332 domain-containing protein [Anaerolineales bacterium]|nr:DUF4332 domain-containing protein [Anaerolineales bacterium]